MKLAQILERQRAWFAAIAVLSLALIGGALYLQHVVGMEPCPLCIFQRYAFLLIAIFAGLAALAGPGLGGKIFGVLTALSALAGAGVAGWQSWLQRHPPEVSSCGPGLDYMLSAMPLTSALPKIFAGSGDCTDPGLRIIGLSLAEWSLIALLIFLVASVVAVRKRR